LVKCGPTLPPIAVLLTKVPRPHWDKDAISDAGAVTWASGIGGTIELITINNSVMEGAASGSSSTVFDYDATNNQLVVGRPAENLVTLFGSRASIPICRL
jgi:hypothetical protein